MGTFQKWYASGIGTIIGADKDTRWYDEILDALNRALDARFSSFVDYYQTVRENLGDKPEPMKQWLAIASFLQVTHINKFPYNEFWDVPSMKSLYKRAIVLKEQAVTGLGKPEFEENWKNLLYACRFLDTVRQEWDGHRASVGEAVQDVIKKIVKSGLKVNPIGEAIIEGAEESAGGFISEHAGSILLIGGAVVGAIILLPRAAGAASAPVRAVTSKAEEQATKVAARIVAKEGKGKK